MRLHLGPPPSIYVPSPEWVPLDEPSPTQTTRIGLLAGIPLGAIVSALWHVGGVSFTEQLNAIRGLSALATFLIALLGLIALHETIHALLHPGSGVTQETVIGASLSPFIFYASYLGAMRRTRFIAMLLAPFIVLSALPATLCATGFAAAVCSPLLAALSVANAAMSGVDLFGSSLIMSQAPRNAVLQNDGWQTYWRPSDA